MTATAKCPVCDDTGWVCETNAPLPANAATLA
jgi:hypothetical protein